MSDGKDYLVEAENADNTSEAISFLERMYPEGPWHLVAINFDGKIEARSFRRSETAEMADWINIRQDEENMYFHVNGLHSRSQNKKASKNDIKDALFLHVDIDDLNGLERLRSFMPIPTVIVFSGGGYHAYWRLVSPNAELQRVENVNRSIAQQVGGDNCHNIDRIMRLPGTINLPNARKIAAGREATLAKIISADWELSYSLDDFLTDNGPEPAGPKGVISAAAAIRPVSVNTITIVIAGLTRQLIETGDDVDRPRSSNTARFRSRSEAVFRVACDLAREGLSEMEIAGILINPAYGISASILEKKNPKAYALKQANAVAIWSEERFPLVARLGKMRQRTFTGIESSWLSTPPIPA
jgi:hypothetical protein